MYKTSSISNQESQSPFLKLAESVKYLSTSKYDHFTAEQILHNWQNLAKQSALNGNIANLKLLLSLLRTLTPVLPDWEIFLHQYMGKLAFIEGLYDQAKNFFELQLKEAERQQNPALIVQAQINLSEPLLLLNRFTEVEDLLQEVIETSHKHRLYLDYIRSLNRVGRMLIYLRNYDTAKIYAEQVLELIRTYPDKQNYRDNRIEIELEEAFAKNLLGSVYVAKRKWQEATVLFEASLKISHHHHDLLSIMDTLIKMGTIHQHLGQQDEALTCFEGCLEICQQLHCLPVSLQAYYYKATTCASLGRFREAIVAALTAVNIGVMLKQNDWLARVYYISGFCYERLGDLKNSTNYYLKASSLYQTGDLNPIWIEPLIGIGDFLLGVRDQPLYWEQALVLYTQAIEIIQSNQQLEYLAPAMGKIAKAFLKVKGLDGLEEAARCYRLELSLAGDLESNMLPTNVAVALRVEALTGIQCCASLKVNPSLF